MLTRSGKVRMPCIVRETDIVSERKDERVRAMVYEGATGLVSD